MSHWTANIVFVRHGFSTVNVLSHVSDLPVHEDSFEYIVDPGLTSIGVKATQHNGKQLLKKLSKIARFKNGINLVVSSNLSRAIETAHYISPSTTGVGVGVTVLPFLKETGPRIVNNKTGISKSHAWNRPFGMSVQKKKLAESGITPIYSFMNKSNWDVPSGIVRFLDWFGEGGRFMLILGNSLSPAQLRSRSFNIIVVTHGGILNDFLKDHQPDFSGPPDNNEAYYGSVVYNSKGHVSKIAPFHNVNYSHLVGVNEFPTSFNYYMYKDKRASEIYNKNRSITPRQPHGAPNKFTSTLAPTPTPTTPKSKPKTKTKSKSIS